jgi:large subunit ribosomal protein L21
MYAVIETGGKQYRVQVGEIVQIEKLDGDVGTAVHFDKVLLAAKPGTDNSQIWLGKPLLSGAKVDGEIVGQGRGDKVTIIKMKRRKQYRRTQGHRQFQTQILITGLANGAGETASLAADQKKATLARFVTQLAPKGLAMTPKTLGSRKRMAAAGTSATTQSAPAQAAAAPKKAAAPKAAAKKAPAKKKAE